jgi:Tol biopolymer transport system component
MNRSDPRLRLITADRLSAALDEVGGAARPVYLDDIVSRAQVTRQRPAWTFPERLLPMSIAVRREGIPRVAILFALLLLLLVAALATTIVLTGAPARPPAPLVVTNGLIAFASGNDIVAVQPDGSGRHVLVPGLTPRSGISFSPDGRRMAYWSQNGALHDLVVADADGSHTKTIASGVVEPTGPPYAVWSPDGTRLAFSARTEPSTAVSACTGSGTQNGDFCTSRIFIAPVDGSGARQVGDSSLDARSPAWSPDGSTIAFGGGNATPGMNVRLYLMNADGSNVRQFSAVRGTDWAFERSGWSHDGSTIAVQASAAADLNEWDIWVVDAKTGDATDVSAANVGDDVLPAWAPDRDALVWAFNDPSRAVGQLGNGMSLKEPGEQPRSIQPASGMPSWSPDGRLLTTLTDANAVQVIDLNGAVKLTLDGATDQPAWQSLRTGG